MSNLKEDIFNFISQTSEKSKFKCGVYPADICSTFKLPYSSIKTHLNQLFKEGKIRLRDGSKGKLIFIRLKRITRGS